MASESVGIALAILSFSVAYLFSSSKSVTYRKLFLLMSFVMFIGTTGYLITVVTDTGLRAILSSILLGEIIITIFIGWLLYMDIFSKVFGE